MTDADQLSVPDAQNRALWDDQLSGWYASRAAEQWAAEPHWGLFARPETDLGVLRAAPGADVIDLGCGTGYIGAWVLRAGGRPVGVDNSAEQLAIAEAMQQHFDLTYPLLHGSAARVDLPDNSFDLSISEHGAIAWCDPDLWLAEVARLLRPGGELVFIRNSTLLELCFAPGQEVAGTTLSRPWQDVSVTHEDGGVTYQPQTGTMVALLRKHGFVLEELIEFGTQGDRASDFGYVTPEWARQWPSEELWRARLQ